LSPKARLPGHSWFRRCVARALHRRDGRGVGLFTHAHVARLLPHAIDVGHDLGVRPLDVDRNANHDPRRKSSEPEHFGSIAFGIMRGQQHAAKEAIERGQQLNIAKENAEMSEYDETWHDAVLVPPK